MLPTVDLTDGKTLLQKKLGAGLQNDSTALSSILGQVERFVGERKQQC